MSQSVKPKSLNLKKAYPLFGIKNFRSTCFANSVFQVLCSLPPFVEYLKKVNPTDDMKYTKAIKDMFNLFLQCNKVGIQKEIIHPPQSMKEIIMKLQTESGQHQMDATEFYTTLINCLHTECKNKISEGEEAQQDDDEGWEEVGKKFKKVQLRSEKTDGTSVISDYFRGSMRSLTITIDEMKKKHNQAVLQEFYVLSLPIQSKQNCVSSVSQAINLAFSKRKIDNTHFQQLFIEEAPKVLVLQLNRFIYDRVKLDVVKLVDHINYTESLQLKTNKGNVNYRLISIIEHRGNQIRRGHYVSYVRRGEKWYFCNDENIQLIDQKDIYDKMAYVLIYSSLN
ncbi:ubiquitin carboxyl-terminal hydrolase domain containing protein [Entamoeba histolytica HM-1:IMSS-B]|uniref:Ubiquitin carboxyl-terminal hydrolase, putative n=6 Tax=Entamoeba histolytica TaxID=5759 RepID=C4LXH7_ENTH1|nr:ubiquitin carboxyl-terminal hydrolase, putative [Entamoeba histolytica HM-1:IMSS]EMD43152.1 ubiquitin carboxylterminal hydrolase, putative [Entamoeba histolytica KU27]EMH73037.1 ubiquitin carboxyl-terminal hydrolase domain containing protein [Entamoeba histolytica HM-1:IMSS-B]EMS15415.1 ubiquitin carboxyl-terminal hydrolase, putative [Entamoeba histolytica HM-3:IMSS]ENY60756.1 ubiquitin carboxyl-terminal hydrolase, putative [Entamoeba histolytica HM-1:IMSS-A]GAT93456.1 ubiquitin carboxyl-te|eukprot:XP_655521.1 ubiquitin carboxyl-terminal hydrolase, putative [Entamoeba histolytica HM-1:IMSS]